MGRSQESRNKKEIRTKLDKRRKEKLQRKQEKKDSGKSSFDDMIAYVDSNGVISTTPPDPGKKEEINPDEIRIVVRRREEIEAEEAAIAAAEAAVKAAAEALLAATNPEPGTIDKASE